MVRKYKQRGPPKRELDQEFIKKIRVHKAKFGLYPKKEVMRDENGFIRAMAKIGDRCCAHLIKHECAASRRAYWEEGRLAGIEEAAMEVGSVIKGYHTDYEKHASDTRWEIAIRIRALKDIP